MLKRMVYRASLKKEKTQKGLELIKQSFNKCKRLVEEEKLMTCSLYKWEQSIFLYYECIDNAIRPKEIFSSLENCLEDWPGKIEERKWIPMIDVFHFNEPVNKEHWRRKSPVERRVGKVAYLKAEMVSSYVYYHYQLQEERAFFGDKYEIISLHENLLFGYFEFPKVIEEPIVNKKLNTNGTPKNWHDSHMELHFLPWEDGTHFFKEIEQIITL